MQKVVKFVYSVLMPRA